MKESMNLLLMALLAVGLGMNLTSCKEDEQTEEEQQQAQQAMTEALEWWDVVSQLTDEQTLPDDWQKATFEPAVGTASENDPYTRIVATNDLATAAQRFAYLTGAAVDETTADYTWSHKQAGSLTYHAGSPTGTCLAQVDVDLKQMPRLKKILYQTPEQMGENTSGSFSGSAHYRFGDVVRKKNNSGGYDFWVCVRPAFRLEGKGDSHWISVSPLPDDNIYVKQKDGKEWNLPTKLGESKEHMQNFAELLYAILYPKQYMANLGQNTKLKVFHDFNRNRFNQYHGLGFWDRVSKAWERENLYEKVFMIDRRQMEDMLRREKGLTFLYKGYSWWALSWTCSLWQAYYTGDNLKTATYTTPQKDMRGVEFNAKDFYDHQETYSQNFFGDTKRRFIVRYATGEELSKDANGDGTYSVKQPLSNCLDWYVYNKYFYENEQNQMYDLNGGPEETPKDQEIGKFWENVTKEDVGKIICRNGRIYASMDDVRERKESPVAMVVDVYNTNYSFLGNNNITKENWEKNNGITHGIAIALKDGTFDKNWLIPYMDLVPVERYDPFFLDKYGMKVSSCKWYVPNMYHWGRMMLPFGASKIMTMDYVRSWLEIYMQEEKNELKQMYRLNERLKEISDDAALNKDCTYLVAGAGNYGYRGEGFVSILNSNNSFWLFPATATACRYVLVW